MSTKSKFLVINPSPEGLVKVIDKANLQGLKNGPFEAVLFLGDVLPTNSELPDIDIHQATYFTEGVNGVSNKIVTETESNLVDVKPNLTFMKSMVNVLKLSSGITIAFLSSIAEEESNYTLVKEKLNNANSKIDILVTYNWPYSIAKQERLTLVGDKFIDEIVTITKPRYHFAVGNENGRFFENSPFKWNDKNTITRFISLGQEGSGDKWFYAFGISDEITEVPDSQLIENPFTRTIEESKGFKRSIEKERPTDDQEQSVKKPRIVTPDKCFFCLSNPKVETHMIISIGSYVYLTVAKGPLTRSSKNLPFSGHAIIIPIEHIPTIKGLTPNVLESPVYQEIGKYQQTLAKAFAEQKPFYKLICFEINRSTNIHHHVQILPIPKDLIEKFEEDLEEKSKLNNETFERNHKLNFRKFTNDRDPDLVKIINESDYIIFTIYNSENDKIIYISELTDQNKAIDLQFPRRVLAYTLKCPKRTYWERCVQPKYKEAKDCEEFKNFYQNFDFTLSENA